jgi:hypothetical protein
VFVLALIWAQLIGNFFTISLFRQVISFISAALAYGRMGEWKYAPMNREIVSLHRMLLGRREMDKDSWEMLLKIKWR